MTAEARLIKRAATRERQASDGGARAGPRASASLTTAGRICPTPEGIRCRMEWFVLVLMLSLPPSIRAHCSAECQECAQQLLRPAAFSRLSCSPDCEEELQDCAPVPRLADLTEEQEEPEEQRQRAELAARYGGFIKRLDGNKEQLFTSSTSSTSALEAAAEPRIYQELLERLRGREDARGFVKRYGGFLRKFGPKSKRSSSGEQEEQEESREELQKRYGGFMRRVRPKLNNLRWDKRFGGYLRRQFQLSVRSEEEPL